MQSERIKFTGAFGDQLSGRFDRPDEKAKHPKSFISLHEADHLLMDETFSKYCGSLIAEWSSLYLK